MKSLKRMLICMLACLVAAAPVSALAEELPDPHRKGTISVEIRYKDEPVSGGSLKIYRVARIVVRDAKAEYKYTGAFAGCGEEVNNIDADALGDKKLAERLKSFVEENKVEALKTITVDGEGKASVEKLHTGLYLICQGQAAKGYEAINPFLVSLPSHDGNGELNYAVDASPKVSTYKESVSTSESDSTPEETEPDTKPDTPDVPPNIPKTGQLWWPVPVLGISGLIFFCVGWRRRSRALDLEEGQE